jgi:DNA gyrase subunit B
MEEQNKQNYSGSNIQVLEGLEAVRKRPAMYIGSTDGRGLHHLVWEVVDNSVDEAMGGYCDRFDVEILPGNGIRVIDNGRGIPIDIHPKLGRGTLEVVLTVLHAGGKFDNDSYAVSAGLHGVGVSCVNALSQKLIATVKRDGRHVQQEFSLGAPVADQVDIGTVPAGEHGTTIEFYPDAQIFTELEFHYETLAARCRELAFLNKGLTIGIKDSRTPEGQADEFCYPGGIASFVEYMDQTRKPLFPAPIHLVCEAGKYPLEVAIQYNDSYQENFYSFVNNVNTYDGGTHVTGFKAALTRVITKFASEALSKSKKDIQISGDDIREGLTAVIAIRISQPQFEGQTKRKLGNSEAKGLVETIVGEKLEEYFQEHPAVFKPIIDKVFNAAVAREAAHRARNLARRKSVLEGGGLPGKLADCSSRKPEECELFIVEGDSAGGSAKQGRSREFQAILPLKGKILNVEKARLDKILESEEIQVMVSAIGTGIGVEFKIEKLRYHKIIIMTDADVDGSHIQTLIMTFFFRQMRQLIEGGHIFLAQPPLYRVKIGKEERYLFTEEEKDSVLGALDDRKNIYLQRYKGLGEMNPDQLAETTMIPAKRVLKQIRIEDVLLADQAFTMLMGEEVEPRRRFIEENAHLVMDSLDL